MNNRKMRPATRLFCSISTVLLVAAAGVALRGRIRGIEFAPPSFERRHFTMWQDPFLRLPLGPVVFQRRPDDLVAYLSAQPWWPGRPAADGDFVVMSAAGGTRSWTGNAALMSEFLGGDPRRGPSPWLRWSREHPDLAGTLWPAVFQVVQQGRYEVVPDLFAAALMASSPDGLAQELRDIRAAYAP